VEGASAVGLGSVAAKAFADFFERVPVGISCRLLAALDRFGLAPVLLGFEPFAEFACAVCVHELAIEGERSAAPSAPLLEKPPYSYLA
jgi:hypothetical protein